MPQQTLTQSLRVILEGPLIDPECKGEVSVSSSSLRLPPSLPLLPVPLPIPHPMPSNPTAKAPFPTLATPSDDIEKAYVEGGNIELVSRLGSGLLELDSIRPIWASS